MTRWAVIFDDTVGMLEQRRRFSKEHLAYLEENSDRILIGGGLRPAPEEPFVGGLWIVEAATYDEVVSLVTNDPYFNQACRQFKILAWGKAFDKPVVL